MARVTVEDCIEVVPNRFDLVVLSARRARDLAAGAYLTIPRDNDKNPVVALREIAEQTVNVELLKESVIKHLQRFAMTDAAEEDLDQELQDSFDLEVNKLGVMTEHDDRHLSVDGAFEDALDAQALKEDDTDDTDAAEEDEGIDDARDELSDLISDLSDDED